MWLRRRGRSGLGRADRIGDQAVKLAEFAGNAGHLTSQ
ncbi:hypothetical protein MPS_4088 [Mycobacterium pseudoshottsii JCM 15466]|nr:hypothetical protein MMSP_2338 [Mycobacterium sp. 012931]GAQ38282.1 hypothetical protein MPS_4088 [Mycobacterium pseudoshottsii JCM 15466]